MPVLVRTGKVLITVGVIDIGVMIYCIANEISYSSSFNIFAVIAGFFLMLAQQELGAGYKYHVSSLGVVTNKEGTFVSGVVTACNPNEIRNVPVAWHER